MLDTSARGQAKRDEAHYAVHFANRALVRRTWSESCYTTGRAALDDVMLYLAKAKWLFGRGLGTHSGFADQNASVGDVGEAVELFDYVTGRAREIQAALERGEEPPPAGRAKIVPARLGAEILHADGIPIVPASCPVVVLQGTNRAMGRQYALQILEVFGDFILGWHAGRVLSDEQVLEIRKWELQLDRYAPEIIDFARGMAEGATAWGLPMDDDRALAIFTGVRPPAQEARPFAFAQSDKQQDDIVASYLGIGSKGPTETPAPCSGGFAWGEATTDGALVAGASTDHDCTFQATIIAFPSEGNDFVITPYSANGSIPILGHFHLAGHPGMNNKGLAYVHHGGANMGEPEGEWGYGLRRGPAVMHILQFCDSAKDALDYMLSLPVGDSAISLGTAGGMFADRTYGFSLEARSGCPDNPQPILREATYDACDRPLEVLYGSNNALAPESAHLNAPPTAGKGYDYSKEGGWHTFDPDIIQSGTPGQAAKRRMTKNSEGRNRYLYSMLVNGYGQIDLDYATKMYRVGGTIPPGDFDAVCARYDRGEQWDCSAAHRGNAFVAVLKPDDGEGGVYRACIGPANRAVNNRDPGHGYYYYDETAAFWEIVLAASPAAVLRTSLELARARAITAAAGLQAIGDDFAGRDELEVWLTEARRQIASATEAAAVIDVVAGDERCAAIGRALRRANSAQVRANQVIDAVDTVASPPAPGSDDRSPTL